jgi:hypothetical protein
MKNYLHSFFWGTVKDGKMLIDGIQTALNALAPAGIFTGDNLFAFGRNLSFLDDNQFMSAFYNNSYDDIEKSVIWRRYVLCWAARQCLKHDGDFVEAACYKGLTAKMICEYTNFGTTDKNYYLYDLFEHSVEMDHHAMPEHGVHLHEEVKNRFLLYKNVKVIKGCVPDILMEHAPEEISFMHLDLNGAEAELGALNVLFEKVVRGGIIILDDYGWLAYRAQKEAEDPFFEERGYRVLELPTGQGMVIK